VAALPLLSSLCIFDRVILSGPPGHSMLDAYEVFPLHSLHSALFTLDGTPCDR
jgi:hypothetical protein